MKIWNLAGIENGPEFARRDLLLSPDRQGCAVALVGVGDQPAPPDDLPFLCIGKGDAADLYQKTADWAAAPNCIAIVKATRLVNWSAPAVDGRHFVTHLPGDWGEAAPGLVPARPVYPWSELLHRRDMLPFVEAGRRLVKLAKAPPRTRPIWWAGTVNYDETTGAGRAITAHRTAVDRYNGGRLPADEYRRRLLETDVALSPWGWGEPCLRDWEAILCGCAAVKPACPWVRCASHLYWSDRMTWCRPDWSDLDSVVDRASARPWGQRRDDMAYALDLHARRDSIRATALARAVEGLR